MPPSVPSKRRPPPQSLDPREKTRPRNARTCRTAQFLSSSLGVGLELLGDATDRQGKPPPTLTRKTIRFKSNHPPARKPRMKITGISTFMVEVPVRRELMITSSLGTHRTTRIVLLRLDT